MQNKFYALKNFILNFFVKYKTVKCIWSYQSYLCCLWDWSRRRREVWLCCRRYGGCWRPRCGWRPAETDRWPLLSADPPDKISLWTDLSNLLVGKWGNSLPFTFILGSVDAMEPGLTLTQKTPSSLGSWGLPGCPLRPPLTIIPSFSPSCFLTVISMKPAGRGSCWTVSLMISHCCRRDMTASWWLTLLMLVSFTAKILSPIRSFPVAAAEPPGIILLM